MRIFSIGHGTRPIDDFLALLGERDIRMLADIRTHPGSRRHPQFGQSSLRGALGASGIEYVHLGGLGGRRDPRPDSPHSALRVAAFRGYADHMASEEFASDLARLEELAAATPTAYMCAETHWWRCHRRMLSDVLTVHGWQVVHLLTPGKQEAHRLWEVARVVDGRIFYDAVARQVALGSGRE